MVQRRGRFRKFGRCEPSLARGLPGRTPAADHVCGPRGRTPAVRFHFWRRRAARPAGLVRQPGLPQTGGKSERDIAMLTRLLAHNEGLEIEGIDMSAPLDPELSQELG